MGVTGWSSNGSSYETIPQSFALSNSSSWSNLFLGYDLKPESVFDIKITHLRLTPVE